MEAKEVNFIHRLPDIAGRFVVLPTDPQDIQEAKRSTGFFVEASDYNDPESIARVVARWNERGKAQEHLLAESRSDWLLVILATNPGILDKIDLPLEKARKSLTYFAERLIKFAQRSVELFEIDHARNPNINDLDIRTQRLSARKSLHESLTQKSTSKREKL